MAIGPPLPRRSCHALVVLHCNRMVSVAPKSIRADKGSLRSRAAETEERSLAAFNRLIAKAAPKAARETAAALQRFHRGIAADIRRAR